METKEVNCSVCNHPLNISKENVYVAKNVKNLLFGNEDWSATDCPYCGCQNLLKRRFEKAVKQFVGNRKMEDMGMDKKTMEDVTVTGVASVRIPKEIAKLLYAAH